MLWFYESFFPVVWIFFLLYWQIKAFNTKTYPAPRTGCLAHPGVFIFLDRDRPLLTTRIPLPWLYLQLWPVGFWPFWLGAASPSPAFCSPSGRAGTSAATGAAPSPLAGHELITTGSYAVGPVTIYTGILAGFLGMAMPSLKYAGSSFSFSFSSLLDQAPH